MEKYKKQGQEASLTDAYSLFVYAIRTQITRDYYLRRLRSFFDYIELLPSARIEIRCNQFAALAIKDQNWTFSKIIGFLQFQKERVESEEITAATLYNFVKALKLFCEMSDVPVSWKKITRGLPKARSFADALIDGIINDYKNLKPCIKEGIAYAISNGRSNRIASRSFEVKYRMFDRMYEADENYENGINESEIAASVLPYIISMEEIYSRMYPYRDRGSR